MLTSKSTVQKPYHNTEPDKKTASSAVRTLPAVPVLQSKAVTGSPMQEQEQAALVEPPAASGHDIRQRMGVAQLAVRKEGGKGSVTVTSAAKNIAGVIKNKTSIHPGGSNHIADVQGRNKLGYRYRSREYVGGDAFGNDPQPDGSRLPYSAGQTYTEWDVLPCVAGVGRGAERIVLSSDGTVYYTNDHYNNFTEFSV